MLIFLVPLIASYQAIALLFLQIRYLRLLDMLISRDHLCHLSDLGYLLAPAEFAFVSVTTAEEHDRTIAFTSQLAHVVSNAYIKSPTALLHKGFSAGSYRDMTRVAWLNAPMWAELFIENRDNLIREIDCISESLLKYRQALAAGDEARLAQLLEDGRKLKEEVDGR